MPTKWLRSLPLTGLLLTVIALPLVACAPDRPVRPLDVGWLSYDASGRGSLVGQEGSGPVDSSPVDIDSPGDPWMSVYVPEVVQGVHIRHGVDVSVNRKTRLTVGGKRSRDFHFSPELTIAPFDSDLRVEFIRKGTRLVATSVDASMNAYSNPRDGLGEMLADAHKATSKGPRPLSKSEAAEVLRRARRLAAAHPEEWLYLDDTGFGFVRGQVGARGTTSGPRNVWAYMEVEQPRRLNGLPVLSQAPVLLDDQSMIASGTILSSAMDVLWLDESPGEDGPFAHETAGSLFAVKRDRAELRLLVADLRIGPKW